MRGDKDFFHSADTLCKTKLLSFHYLIYLGWQHSSEIMRSPGFKYFLLSWGKKDMSTDYLD